MEAYILHLVIWLIEDWQTNVMVQKISETK